MPDTPSNNNRKFDYILVGGGLSNCLIALRVSAQAPNAQIAMVEAQDDICGDHTWSFHATDVTEQQRSWLKPLLRRQWPKNKVRFPRYDRVLRSAYLSIDSASLRRAVAALPNILVRTNTQSTNIDRHSVELSNGETLSARVVIDGRGFEPAPELKLGYQKFLGFEIETEEPHGETIPTIMDAAVPQYDGYRFVYLLPYDEKRILVEDTRYTDEAVFSTERFQEGIESYVASRGWKIRNIIRRESGVLPVTLAFDATNFWRRREGSVPQVGLRAALFHPTTGYSLPSAVAIADLVAQSGASDSAAIGKVIEAHALQSWRKQRMFELLNRMLFRAAAPDQRYRVLERFYTLPQGLIDRFYAGKPTLADKIRLLAGKPPVPVSRAIQVLSPSSVQTPIKKVSYGES